MGGAQRQSADCLESVQEHQRIHDPDWRPDRDWKGRAVNLGQAIRRRSQEYIKGELSHSLHDRAKLIKP